MSVAEIFDMWDAVTADLRAAQQSRAARTEHRTTLVRSDGTPCIWREIREHVLTAAGYRCALCDATATEVDHIWPRRWGGGDHLENLQALCGPCNKAKGVSLDLGRASNRDLLSALDAAISRNRTEFNGTLRDVAMQMYERVPPGEMKGASARRALNILADVYAEMAEVARSWAGDIPLYRNEMSEAQS